MSTIEDDCLDCYRLLDEAACEMFSLSMQHEMDHTAVDTADAAKLARVRALMAIADARLVAIGGKLGQQEAAA
jgi:hypothetical protein